MGLKVNMRSNKSRAKQRTDNSDESGFILCKYTFTLEGFSGGNKKKNSDYFEKKPD